MSTQVIETPGGIPFAGFYYPEILREILSFLRQNRDRIGLTDENEYEVHVQLARAFALVGHLTNTRTDVAATELLFDSANLLESIKRLLRLVGIELRSASPAAADLVCKLGEVTTFDQADFIPQLAEFSTDSTPPITYEALTAQDLDRTDRVGVVYGLEQVDSGAASGNVLSMVSTVTGDVVSRDAGAWPADVVGHHLFIRDSLVNTHNGEFRCTTRLNDFDIRVVRIPGSKAAGFQADSGLANWSLKKFTTDYASDANSDGVFFSPWATPEVEDMLYVGHPQVLHTKLDLTFNTVAAGITGVWEYPDNERSLFTPNVVSDLGSTLELECTSLLGTADRSGSLVTVTYLKTGASEQVVSVFSGGKNKVTTNTLLGQVTASTDQEDYSITSDWVPLDNQADATIDGGSALAKDEAVEWDLPETLVRQWMETDVNLVDAYWCRFRIVSATTPTAPSLDRIKQDGGDQYIKTRVTQGETIGPQVIGSSTGQQSQQFNFAEIPFIDDTETVEVDEGGAGNWVEYARVLSFLGSAATDRHYVREANAEGRATITFGNGTNAKIPPAGINNIRATYRVGGDVDGNVGAIQIVTNAEGIAGISEVSNPRSALGWRIMDGGDEADLKRVKREAPAEQRIRGTASSAPDVAYLARTAFVDSSGIKPVARAWAVEEGFGAKTLKLLVVGAGGNVLTQDQLDELAVYFNGDKTTVPPTAGVLVMNHRVIPVNYEPVLVSVNATVTWPGGSAERIRNQLLAFLTPLALEDDEVTYVWNFGSQVSFSRVHSLIHEVDPGVRDVPLLTINGVAGSLTQSENELPVTTAASIAINTQEA